MSVQREFTSICPPSRGRRQKVAAVLSAFHPIPTEEVARLLGRTSAIGIRETEQILKHMLDLREVKHDERGWRIC